MNHIQKQVKKVQFYADSANYYNKLFSFNIGENQDVETGAIRIIKHFIKNNNRIRSVHIRLGAESFQMDSEELKTIHEQVYNEIRKSQNNVKSYSRRGNSSF